MYLVMIGMDKDIEQITKLLLSLKDNANSFSQDVAAWGGEIIRKFNMLDINNIVTGSIWQVSQRNRKESIHRGNILNELIK